MDIVRFFKKYTKKFGGGFLDCGYLQMQHAFLDLLSAALVPELGADIAAGAAGDIHLVLIAVAAVGAFPDQLAVILHDGYLAIEAADLAEVALGVQLGVHDIVVDVADDLQNGLDVLLHIGNFHVADGAAGGESLELGLEGELGESIDLLGDVDVVGVGDIALVGDSGDDAEALLKALGELIGGGLQRSSVEGEVDIVGGFPLAALGVHVFHDLKGEGGGLGIGVGLAGHVLHALIEAGVAERNGGVTAVEQLVDGFTFFEAGQCAVLPENGRGVGEGTLQTLVAAEQCAVAQLEALLKNFPELFAVCAGAEGNVNKVDGDNALIEAAVVLGLSGLGVHIGGEEAAAAHAGVAVTLAVLVHLQLEHHLLADIVGDHALCGALGAQLGEIPIGRVGGDVLLFKDVDELGEGGGDPDAALVLYALIALEQSFFDDEGKVFLLLLVSGFAQIHEHGDERSLSVGGEEGDHLILDGLNALVDLVAQALFGKLGKLLLGKGNADGGHLFLDGLADLLAAHVHEGGEMGEGDALSAVLITCNLSDYLGGDVAGGGEAMGLFDEGSGDDGAVLKHILEVYEVAVVHMLGVIVGVMEVDDALVMGLDDLLGQQDAAGEVLADFAGHIVALGGVDDGVFVGVFLLGLFVVALDEAEDLVVGGVCPAGKVAGEAIADVALCGLGCALHDDVAFDKLLNFFNGECAANFFAVVLDDEGDVVYLALAELGLAVDLGNGLAHRVLYLLAVKVLFASVSLNYLHLVPLN